MVKRKTVVVIIVSVVAVVAILWILRKVHGDPERPVAPIVPIKPMKHQRDCPPGPDTDLMGVIWKTFHQATVDDEVTDNLDIITGARAKPIGEVLTSMELPETFDARDKWPGRIIAPINQFDCGSCWAFATATFLGDRIRINSDKWLFSKTEILDSKKGDVCIFIDNLDTLSPYSLAACDVCDSSDSTTKAFKVAADECNQKCQGGILQNALLYVHRHGLVAIGCTEVQKYQCTDNHHCPLFFIGPPIAISQYDSQETATAREHLHYFTQAGEGRLQTNINSIKSEIMQNGPVMAGIQVYQSMLDQFETSPGTVYEGKKSGEMMLAGHTKRAADVDQGGHAIVVIGWTTYKKNDGSTGEAWIIRNSWGSTWNKNGYFLIETGAPGVDLETDVWAANPVLPPGVGGQSAMEFRKEWAGQIDRAYGYASETQGYCASEALAELDVSDAWSQSKKHMIDPLDWELFQAFYGPNVIGV
jgi:hypothetical protein